MIGPTPRYFVVGLFLAALAAPLLAATKYVDNTPPPPATCPGSGTQSSPYCKIQDAICHSVGGDLVSVAPGTYNESLRMRPGVSVVSTGGYQVTTIDATGKPCIKGVSTPPDPVNDYCSPIVTTTQCTTVVFGSNFVNADRLDGFTIKGGKGLNRAAESKPKIAGGGIFAVSSPTISNNLIMGNNLQGPQQYYFGGGIYLNATTTASPVITRNTIDGNRVDPVSGSPSNQNVGIGGGIYSGFGVRSTISENIITNNVAGDVNVSNQRGYGAGISVYQVVGGTDTVITRNLISGNIAENFGGGIYVGIYSLGMLHTPATITNNEIRGNSASGGGGISTFYCIAKIVNNTIVGNAGFQGGGIFVDKGNPGDVVTIANNLFTTNSATDAVGGGGGLFVRNQSPFTPLTVRNNDFFGNTPAGKQVGGARTDGNTIGVTGNIAVNPLYINAAGHNYHLAQNSPVIDAGNNADASGISVDADGTIRIVDGNGDGSSLVDMGQYEFWQLDRDADGSYDITDPCPLDAQNDQDLDGICVGDAYNPPKTGKNDNCATTANPSQTNSDADTLGDACDNCPTVSNQNQANADGDTLGTACDNCPTVTNQDQLNTDLDGSGNACDPDDDNDGFLDGSDCAPVAPSVHGPPTALGPSLRWSSRTVMWWQRVPGSQGNTYNVYRGTIPAIGMRGTYNHVCYEEDSPDPSTIDATNPSVNTARYYLVSARNRCGESGLGTKSNGQARPNGTPCTLVLRDSDGDGFVDVDDNCAVWPNVTQADADVDGIGNACELDLDGDGVDSSLDCAPSDPGSFLVPPLITGVNVTKTGSTQVIWGTINAGTSTRYDVATGRVSDLHGGPGFVTGTCLGNDRTAPPLVDARPNPNLGDSYYYMVRGQNACGTPTYGTPIRDTHGLSATPCP